MDKIHKFVAYKLPKYKQHSNNLIREGISYAYITSKSPSLEWTLSKIPINCTESILGHTLIPFYNNESDLQLSYNDEPPPDSNTPENEELGHTKGVIIYNNYQGFWLIHSIPHFPPVTSYNYPQKGTLYGQNIICISMNATNLNNVGEQMRYNQPNIYKSMMKPKMQHILPFIYQLIQKEFVKIPPWNNLKQISSLNGHTFLSFAKSKQFAKDLYVDWVATELKTDLDVESWLHGPGRLDSDCSKVFKVKNVEMINMTIAKIVFKSETDHSKWAVSTNSENKWICIGDINRAEHQKTRGGGTICVKEFPQLWLHYYDMITKIEPCDKN